MAIPAVASDIQTTKAAQPPKKRTNYVKITGYTATARQMQLNDWR